MLIWITMLGAAPLAILALAAVAGKNAAGSSELAAVEDMEQMRALEAARRPDGIEATGAQGIRRLFG